MNHLDYLDFDVEIGQPTGQAYPLTVLRSPAGEARATLTWPFGELALENRLKDLQIALLSSGGVRRTVLTPAEAAVQRFGAELFELLFTGEVRNRYDVSQERVHHQEKGLRVKLRIQDPRLANLPWEFLYDARRDEYLCLSQQTPLVRYLELPQTIRPLAVTPPLRLLGMIAGPSDLPALDLQVERQRLERAIAPLQDKGLVQLHWLEGATWRDLQRILRREAWHIFHFVGHGSFDPQRDEGLVAFCNDENKAHLLPANELGRLLTDQRTLRLAVLNACLGAQGSNRDLFSSVAATLVRRGIPAVVAMQQAITDAAAIEFTQTFYESLADGLPVDAAMSEARKAISFALTNTLEWGTPVLYSRASDGHLFTVASRPGGSRSASTSSATGGQSSAELVGQSSAELVEAEPNASAHSAGAQGVAANLPGRGEDVQQRKEPTAAPSRKVDDPSRTPANRPADLIVSDEERGATEQAALAALLAQQLPSQEDTAESTPPVANLLGRIDDNSQKQESLGVPSRNVDDPSHTPANRPAGPIVSDNGVFAIRQATGYRWYILTLAALTFTFVMGLSATSLQVLFVEIASELGLTLVQVGWIWMIGAVSGIVVGVVGGPMIDRLGPRRTLTGACLLVGLVEAARGLAWNFPSLAAAMFVMGFAQSSIPMGIYKTCAIWFHGPRLGTVNGAVLVGMNLGIMLGSPLAATVFSPWLGGWRNVFLVYGVVALLFSLLWWLAQDKADEATHTVSQQLSLQAALRHVASIPNVWRLSLATLGVTACINGMLGHLPLYLQDQGWPTATIGIALAVFHAASMVAVIPIALFSDRLGLRKGGLMIAALLVTIAVGLLAIVQGSLIWLAVIMAGIVRDGYMAITITAMIEVKGVGARYTGTATGILMAVMKVGMMLSLPLGNSLAALSPSAPFAFWAALALLGLVGYWFVEE